MVNNLIWERLASVAREHTGVSIFGSKHMDVSRLTDVVNDMGLEGELATDFMEAIESEFEGFSFNDSRGDFYFPNYFESGLGWVGKLIAYFFSRKLIELDRVGKFPITLGMLEDAISRGYWETARYKDWPKAPHT